MTDIIKAAGHSDTETSKNSYVVDNIQQEELDRVQNPKRTVDNIPSEEINHATKQK